MNTYREEIEDIRLTPEVIGRFLENLSEKGRSPASLQNYRTILMGLYAYLPEDKILSGNILAKWRKSLEEQGYYARTINTRISVLNSFLQYLNHREWQQDDFYRQLADDQPELTRKEYLRLLQAAKLLEKERVYLLIKTLGGAGVRIQELHQLTVEAVREGSVRLSCHHCERVLKLPEALRKELLDYAGREGIYKGPVFVTRDGMPLARSSVWRYVNSVSRDAQVPEEKANPRCLWKMYKSTCDSIRADIDRLAAQAYERMMEEEQLLAGWKI